MKYFAGIDLGGTKMLTAILDEKLKIVVRHKVGTPALRGGQDLVNFIRSALDASRVELQKASGDPKATISALGMTIPGTVDLERGYLIDTPNLGVQNFPLKGELRKVLGIPVILENDVSAGIYGELTNGVAKGHTEVIGLYPGTGVGGGIIIGGKLYHGVSGAAGEFGHMKVQQGGRLCGCGQYGCLEAVASKTALAKDLVHLASTGRAPTILEKAGTDFTQIRSGLIRKSIENGEKAVLAQVERAAWYIGIGAGNLINAFNPELVVIGGGLSEKLWEWMKGPIKKGIDESAMPFLAKAAKVKQASLGDDSVAVGVAALAREASA